MTRRIQWSVTIPQDRIGELGALDGETYLDFALRLRGMGLQVHEISERLETTEKSVGGAFYRHDATVRDKADESLAPTVLLDEVSRLRRENARGAGRLTVIREALLSEIQALPKVDTLPDTDVTGASERVVVLLCGDIQYGTKMLPQFTGGREINQTEFRRMAGRWAGGAANIVLAEKALHRVERIEVWMLGDYIEGETMFPAQGHWIDVHATTQVRLGARMIAIALQALLARTGVREITVRWVAGNHGRLGKKGENFEASNLDYLFADLVAAYTGNDADRIAHHVCESPWYLFQLPGTREVCCLQHGDSVERPTANGMLKAARDIESVEGVPVTIYAQGDHHTEVDVEENGKWRFCNGNWVGGNRYSLEKMRKAGVPRQKALVVDPLQGVVSRHDIWLRGRPEAPSSVTVQDTPTRQPERPLPRTPTTYDLDAA